MKGGITTSYWKAGYDVIQITIKVYHSCFPVLPFDPLPHQYISGVSFPGQLQANDRVINWIIFETYYFKFIYSPEFYQFQNF